MNILIRYIGHWGAGDLLFSDPAYDCLKEKYGVETKIYVEGECGNIKFRPDFLGPPPTNTIIDITYDIKSYKNMVTRDYARLESLPSMMQHMCSYVDCDCSGKRPRIHLIKKDTQKSSTRLKSLSKKFIISICTDGFDSRRHWSIDKWASLINMIRRHHHVSIVLVGMGHVFRRRTIDKIFPPKLNVDLNLLKIPLRDTAAVIGRSNLFIGSNSGLLHFAQAADTPCIFLAGPHYPERYIHESGPTVRYVQASNLPCINCMTTNFEYMVKHKCITQPPGRCMDEITVDNVYDITRNLINEITVK